MVCVCDVILITETVSAVVLGNAENFVHGVYHKKVS